MKSKWFIFVILSVFLVSFISCTKKDKKVVVGSNFSIELTSPWYETKYHIYLEQIKKASGDLNIRGYTDGPNSSNFFFVSEISEYQKKIFESISEEFRGYPESTVNYNGNEYHIIMDQNNSFVRGIAYLEHNDILFLFGFNIENSKKAIVDQILMSAKFEKPENDIKKLGFFTGVWHGLRTPFVFIINLFKTDDYVIFSDNRGASYTVGFVLGIIFILSSIFGGSRGRY